MWMCVDEFAPNEIAVRTIGRSLVIIECVHAPTVPGERGVRMARKIVLPREFDARDVLVDLTADRQLSVRINRMDVADREVVRDVHIRHVGRINGRCLCVGCANKHKA